MPEQVTVIITETTPGGGSRFYQEPGRPSSVDVDSLTPNTEYRADAEYEAPDGTTIQASNSMTFRTLPVGMFSISNPNWQNDNDGQHSTFTFDYTSTYALSYAQVVDMATSVTYQGTISGNTVTAQLPAGTVGTQHNFQLIIADIYGYSYVQGYVMTLQASLAETPFYIEAENPSDAPQIALTKTGSPASLTMQISFDKSTWTNYTIGDSIELNEEHPKVYFKNLRNTNFSTGTSKYYNFTADDYVNVGGNIASLKSNNLSNTTSNSYDFRNLFYNNQHVKNIDKLYLGNYTTAALDCYWGMFSGCTSLTSIPSGLLPATTLATECYREMFSGCTSLTTIPSGFLPATTLANECYREMFSGCTSLTTIPRNLLPATIATRECYWGMFSGCTSLTTIPSGFLPATTVDYYSYFEMFNRCTSLTSVPRDLLPATTLNTVCYGSMFYGCTSLINMPDLPATTLALQCYQRMFFGCTSATTPPSSLPATTLLQSCYIEMFYNCTSLTRAPEIYATTLARSCCKEMFHGCTSLIKSPVLLSSRLEQECYYRMFFGCSSLKEITCLAETNNSVTNCLYQWVYNVAPTGTFYKSPNARFWYVGDISSVPANWDVVDYQN